MASIAGTVFRSGGKERIPYATIKAIKKGHALYATTDESGEFSIDLPEKGAWSLVVLEAGSYASKPIAVDMDQEQQPKIIYLDPIAETSDEYTGKIFFWTLVGVLMLLIVIYILVHLYLVKPEGEFSIWSDEPLRFIEIFLWGLAGILVSKIITTGWYLRNHRFYREGILMHIAHIIATPILVLVTVFLLSEVALSFTLDQGNEITIDLSVPALMVAFAFTIGTSPWPLWNFILKTAKRFTGQLE
jgi:hypothetical protein